MKIFVADNSYPALSNLAHLFVEYYSEMSNTGNLLPLTVNGDQLWLQSVIRSNGKTSVLILVEELGIPVGFAQGQLKISPDYLGNLRLGNVSHFYLKKDYRGGETATLMFSEMLKWFKEKNVHSIELQVLKNNIAAEKFWKKMGLETELSQMRLKF